MLEASTNEEVRREGARSRLHKISGTCMQGPAKIQSSEECFPESDDESPVHTKKNEEPVVRDDRRLPWDEGEGLSRHQE